MFNPSQKYMKGQVNMGGPTKTKTIHLHITLTINLYQFFTLVLIWWYTLSNASITRFIYTLIGKMITNFCQKYYIRHMVRWK